MTSFMRMLKDQSGASAAEYALILAVIGSALALSAVQLGNAIGNSINRTDTCLSTKGATCS